MLLSQSLAIGVDDESNSVSFSESYLILLRTSKDKTIVSPLLSNCVFEWCYTLYMLHGISNKINDV